MQRSFLKLSSSRFTHAMLYTLVYSNSSVAREKSIQACNSVLNSEDVCMDDGIEFFSTHFSDREDAKDAMDTFQKIWNDGRGRMAVSSPPLTCWALGSCMFVPPIICGRHIRTQMELSMRSSGRMREISARHLSRSSLYRTLSRRRASSCLGELYEFGFSFTRLTETSRLLDFRSSITKFAVSPRNAYVLLDMTSTCVAEATESFFVIPQAKVVMVDTPEERARHSARVKPHLIHVLSCFGIATAISSQTEEEKRQSYNTDLRVRADWESVMDNLERPEDPSSSEKLDPSVVQAMRAVTRELGWVSTSDEDINYRSKTAHDSEELLHQGCHYFSCLCFGSKPRHRLYVCKGCRKASYCSRQCLMR